jgi:hypothetical protein
MCEPEPTLEEMLRDPIVLAVMARDRVSREELRACVARAAVQFRRPGASCPERATYSR